MSHLTEAQKQRMEENRQKALQMRAAKRAAAESSVTVTSAPPITPGAPNGIKPKCFNTKLQTNAARSPLASSKATVCGDCIAISKDRFEVQMGYSVEGIEMFKTIKSKRYDPQSKHWNFDIADHNELKNKMDALKPNVCLKALPQFVVNAVQRQSTIQNAVDLTKIDKTLLESLMPFQREGVEFGIQRGGRLLLADDMGLGKTIQALGIMSYYSSDWPLLIVCPSSVKYGWVTAIDRWLPSFGIDKVNVVETSKEPVSGHVVILSYDMMHRRAKDLEQRRFKAVIFDESHFIKNYKAARTQTAQKLLKRASRVIMLSGTPALSRPVELYTQITGIDHKIFTNFHEFGVRYCQAKETLWGWDYSGACNMKELHVVLDKIMLRRLKKDVLAQLPSKQRQIVVLDPASVPTHKLKVAADMMQKENMKSGEKRGALLTFFSHTASVKAIAVKQYIMDILEGSVKMVVFAHHACMLDHLADALAQRDIAHIRIDGSTSSHDRDFLCQKFQTNDTFKVALLSITAANTGITLTAAALVIFAELFWNPGILTQAEDRAYRIGQQDSVDVRYLVAKHTADDYLLPMIREKLNILNKAGLSKDDFSGTDVRQATILSYLQQFMNDDVDEDQLVEAAEDAETQEVSDHLPEKRPKLN